MLKTKWRTEIKHPDWLKVSDPCTSLRLYLTGRMPESIAGWMIVTSLKHPLRAVYGSDLRAALALLWQAIGRKGLDEIRYQWWRVRHPKEVEEMDEDIVRGWIGEVGKSRKGEKCDQG